MINNSSTPVPPSPSSNEPTTTGKFIVLFAPNRSDALGSLFGDSGINISSTENNNHEVEKRPLEPNNALILHNLNVAVVNANEEHLSNLSTTEVEGGNPILTFELERFVFTQTSTTPTDTPTPTIDESQVTWGLTETRIPNCPLSGRGIRVAILDSGLDMNHPDFANRHIVSQSFIDGETAEDTNGHGTHCAGTSCGSSQPTTLPRYGIAYEAEIYIGKVVKNEKGKAKGTDGTILAGINWAIENNCQIISMSIGARVAVGEGFSQIYETVARQALERGTLIIAAAGNDSFRSIENPIYNPVNHPADCPSIMAVGAVDSQMHVAWFSNRSMNPNSGGVDIVGPGVNIYSSWPLPQKYNTIDGTSMATPHVAGIAALLAQANPNNRGKALWDLLTSTAKSLSPFDIVDVGKGLVQAPNSSNSEGV
ncbi:S8 family serine peptidase [Nostoc muscorum FACHB-395]|jgi:subtilisin family serine protease|nr:S8 family serine peptidase [Desmonostoc muscorum FACHB-395]